MDSENVNSRPNGSSHTDKKLTGNLADDTRPPNDGEAEALLEASADDTQGKDAQDESTEYLPIDRGWAWFIALACFLGILFTGGMMRAYGVFFIQFQDRFQATAAEVSTANIIQNVFGSFAALFVMTIGLQWMSCRVAVLIGGLLNVTGYLIAGYTTSIYVFHFSVGVLAGTGNSMILPPMLLMLGVYFNKHRGFANSIFACGGSVGGLLFGPVVVKLFEKYAYSGGMLIVAGLFMHIFISAALLRPMEFYKRNKGKERFVSEEENDVRENTEKTELTNTESELETDKSKLLESSVNGGLQKAHSQYIPIGDLTADSSLKPRQRAHSLGSKTHYHNDTHINGEPKQRPGHMSNTENLESIISQSVSSLYAGDYNMYGSFINMSATGKDTLYTNSKTGSSACDDIESASESGCCVSVKNSFISVLCTVFDLTLLKDPLFLIFLAMCFCLMPGMIAVTVFLPPHLRDIAITNSQIAILLFIQSGLDLVAKISMGIVADRHWVKRTDILMVAALVLGTTNHMLRFFSGFYWMLFVTIITGLCCGQFVNIYAVILLDLIGPVRFQKSIGMSILLIGLANAVMFPLVGLLRDLTGAYIWSFHLLGLLGYIGAACVFTIGHLHAHKKREQAAETEK